MDGKSRRSSRRKANRRKTRRSSLARLDDGDVHQQHGPARATDESSSGGSSGEQQRQQDLRDQRRAEGEGMPDHRTDSEAEDEFTSGSGSGSGSGGEETELAQMEGRDADEEDLRRSEGEGMLYDAATLEEEQTPRPGKFDTQVEVREGRRLGVTQAEKEKKKKKASESEALDRDEEDLRRSEGEGMLYDAATLEEEQTPRPGKFDTRVEVREGKRLGVTQAEEEKKKALERDEEDLRRSEGEGMLYDAATLEEEQTPRPGKFDTQVEVREGRRLGATQAEEEKKKALERDEEDLRRSEGEGMLYDAATLEEEQTPRPGKFDTHAEVREGKRLGTSESASKSESDNERTEEEPKPESEEEAYERLKREAEEEQRQRELKEEEEARARQAEAEAEELRLKMARDWEELERQREEEERKSREKVEELMRAAESEAERKQREMKEAMKQREATEKMRREHEIDQLVTRQSLEIENRRDDLRRSSAKRMGPVKWVPDEMAAACQSCQAPFTLTRRRHHCRACGKIFCAKCSAKEARVRWYEEPERVCDTCYLYTKGDFEGKVVLMSGANTGVAAEVAEEMARQGAILALLSPEPEEASALAQRIKKATGNTEVMPLWADFGSLDSVNEAVERFRRQFERIDVLINNCDVDPRNGREVHTLTHDGNEKLFSIKYLSHFLVTYQLLDLLKLSTPSRIINVCPKPGKHIHVNFDDLQMEHRWSVERATEQSRLGIYCLTRELGLRLKGSGVAVNVLDLGHVYTSDQSLLSRAWCNIKGDTPDDMAKNAYLYMAASPLTQEVSRGCFLPDCSPTLFRDRTLDDAFCAHFYRASYDLVAKWVARDDRGMMEGRVMESALVERIREATREREELRELEENEKLEIDVGSDLDESGGGDERRRRKGKSKVDAAVDQRVAVEGAAGVKPQLATDVLLPQDVSKDSRGRTAHVSDEKKATTLAHTHVHHDKAPLAAATTQSSLELW